MRVTRVLLATAIAVAPLACGSDGPAGPEAPQLAVRVVAPAAIPTKDVLDIEARIIVARNVAYPIVVTFEKQNVGEAFVPAGSITLRDRSETVAVARLPIFKDPIIRATARDATGLTNFSETTIDVLDFP